MNPSVIREILKVTEKPGIISLAGGLPLAQDLPGRCLCQACARADGASALQYAASEGYGPLREAIAELLPWDVDRPRC
jgi:2-aminoadipate transaminase